MKRKDCFLTVLFILLASTTLFAQQVLQFRGENSTGRYPDTNLLKEWPSDGPELLWEAQGIGNGYSSAVITNSGIFVNGEIDTITYLFALDLKGKKLWKQPIGREWVESYPGSRSTPTVIDNLVYVSAGMGAVACFNANTGEKVWKRNMIEEFGGVNTRFGFGESIVGYGDMVFCTPGGKEKNVVALNRFTGEVEWACEGVGEMPSFCTPLVLELPKRTLLLTFSMGHLLGIDIENGELLWTHEQQGEGDVHANTPYYENGHLYYVAGNGNGTVKLRINDDGTTIEQIWANLKADGLTGGFIKVDDHIYMAGYARRQWYSVNANTGEITDSLRFDNGITIFADNKLYLYNERGRIALCSVDNGSFNRISEFRLRLGSKAHFAHPVINNGILYVRRGESLMAYRVSVH